MEIKRIQLASQLTLEYAEQGDPAGPVLICLHGYTDSWKSYSLLLPHLSEHFQVFALSLRGHGESDRPAADYTPRDFAADVALFIEQLQLGSVIITGHSMGGVIAQQFVLDYPQKTKALVLIDTFSGFAGKDDVAAMLEEVNAFTDPVDPVYAEAFQRSSVAKPVSEDFMQTVVAESLKVPAGVWKAVLGELVKADFIKELQAIRKPALLLWGDQDTVATRCDQDRLLAAVAGARLVVYEGMGHSVHWEAPQRVARDIEHFVKEVLAEPS